MGIISSFIKSIKKYFFSGIFAFLPIGITCYVIIFVTAKINQWILYFTPNSYLSDINNGYSGWIYKCIVVIIVCAFFSLLGILIHLYVGRKLLEISDFFMKKIPFFNKFYNLIKKITSMIADKNSHFFKKVVLIEFPQKGSYSVAFLTNQSDPIFTDSENEYVHVFLPTSPNPTTGFFLMVNKNSIQELDMSLESAMKLIISGGAWVNA